MKVIKFYLVDVILFPVSTFGKRRGDNIFAGDVTHLPFPRNAGS